ncbi:MAG: hypothetical protein KIH62_002880 [Candidatus Kerfeldbacteria bacterium]|nr:hypothetical protein [Candidatus Kerfeldbacteria bacterium]
MHHTLRSNSISVLGLALLGLAGIFLISYAHFEPQPRVKITVFIHGTVGGPLNFLSSSQCSQEFDPECATARAVRYVRNHELMHYDNILGAEGLHEFVKDELPLWHAARHLIPAYDDLAQTVECERKKRHYYTFGWSGYLHHGARRAAAYELYNSLCDRRDEIRTRYGVDPEVELIGYSHGGNVGLWLASAEDFYKRGLTVNTLVMLAAPMQKEMAQAIESPLFTTIVLLSSQGDGIQTRDYFSNKEGRSYARMADIADIKKITSENKNMRRHDLWCALNDDLYGVTHINMWLAGRSGILFEWMDPLPFFMAVPMVLRALEGCPATTEAVCALCDCNNGCVVTIDGTACSAETARELREKLTAWALQMREQWRLADDTSRNVTFNRKNWNLLKRFIWG